MLAVKVLVMFYRRGRFFLSSRERKKKRVAYAASAVEISKRVNLRSCKKYRSPTEAVVGQDFNYNGQSIYAGQLFTTDYISIFSLRTRKPILSRCQCLCCRCMLSGQNNNKHANQFQIAVPWKNYPIGFLSAGKVTKGLPVEAYTPSPKNFSTSI